MVKRNQNLHSKIGVLPTSVNLLLLMVFTPSHLGYGKLPPSLFLGTALQQLTCLSLKCKEKLKKKKRNLFSNSLSQSLKRILK